MEPSPFLGEMVGTAALIYLGNGVVANVVLKNTKGEKGGLIAITAGWSFAVLFGIFLANAFGSPDAHINPAVTIAGAVTLGDYSKLGIYLPAQFLGAFLGACLVWLHYLPHWKATPSDADKLACFSTGPAIKALPSNFLAEMMATIFLLLANAALGKAAGAATGLAAGLLPYFAAILVWGIGLSLGGPTGYAINPARDLGPRIAHSLLPIAGKGSSQWWYAWVPVLGPATGAVIAAIIIRNVMT